jgi:hypothetical protein
MHDGEPIIFILEDMNTLQVISIRPLILCGVPEVSAIRCVKHLTNN